MFFNLKKIKPKILPQENSCFENITKIWNNTTMLRWQITTWCNYSCPYCSQDHSKTKNTHAFDNHIPQQWVTALKHHFKNSQLVLIITGGEPLLDHKNMVTFLKIILPEPFINNIRIDTNLSFNPIILTDLPNKQKLIFNCSFHPTQTNRNTLAQKALSLKKMGFNVAMINYVMYEPQAELYPNHTVFQRVRILS